MSEIRLNAYQIMWLFVFFDLPVVTRKERKAAAKFRKDLERDGFVMMQYSIYIRHCASRENADVHLRRVQSLLPETGRVSVLLVTDKQYSGIFNFWCKPESVSSKMEDEDISEPVQLELF